MKIRCLENDFSNPAARYTVSLMLDQTGIFYEWNEKPASDPFTINLLYAPPDSVNKKAPRCIYLPCLLNLVDLHEQKVEWTEIGPAGETIPVIKQSLSTGLKGTPVSGSFDIVANIYYHLTRIEELDYRHPEEADEKATQSILYRADRFKTPVVDVLIAWFEAQLRQFARDNAMPFLKKSAYPRGESFGLALTHDVDFIRAYHPLKNLLLRLLIKSGIGRNLTQDQMDQHDKDFWAFDRLRRFYGENDLRATFFFLARYIEKSHFRYRINSARLRRLLKGMKTEGHEIGLHPSRFAFDKPRRYGRELERLRSAAQAEISGMRHHYLRCLYPRMWRIQEAAGLQYDAGLLYNHYGGFRAGTCHPFPVFDHEKKKAIDVVEFPTAFFEKSLPDEGRAVEPSWQELNQLMAPVEKYQGILAALWHTNNIYRKEYTPGFWLHFVESMKGMPVFRGTLRQHLHWYRQRRAIHISEIEKAGAGQRIQFSLPQSLRCFALETDRPPEQYRVSSDKVSVRHEEKLIIFEINRPLTNFEVIIGNS